MWYEDYKKLSNTEINDYMLEKLTASRFNAVINTTTKEVFSGAKAAIFHYTGNHPDTTHFYRSIKEHKKAYGFHWQYLTDFLKENNVSYLEAFNSFFFIA